MSLSEKRKINDAWKPSNSFSFYWESDVREAVKEVEIKAEIKIANHTMDYGEDLLIIKRKDFNEIFGEKLI